jgi:hypothetical protein
LIRNASLSSSEGQRSRTAGDRETVVGIYLMKLLSDLGTGRTDETADAEAALSEFFTDDRRIQLEDLRLGLVIPQQSLREGVTLSV